MPGQMAMTSNNPRVQAPLARHRPIMYLLLHDITKLEETYR